jgi:hypothetical protein
MTHAMTLEACTDLYLARYLIGDALFFFAGAFAGIAVGLTMAKS